MDPGEQWESFNEKKNQKQKTDLFRWIFESESKKMMKSH